MRLKILTVLLLVFVIAGASYYYFLNSSQPLTNPLTKVLPPKPKPLLAYTFDNLKNTQFPQSEITLGEIVEERDNSLSQMFYFSVPQAPKSTTSKKVSGVINLPSKPGTYPLIVMFRGFAPKETYQPGTGTQPSARIFSQNGFITIAPDFLGYGQSDESSQNDFENRFRTYTTALTLLSSLPTLNSGLEASYSARIKADINKVGMWGHSNGGQIALSVLAISGANYPTVLWAPVSKSFPYSILYYTDESDDQGKALRQALSQFEQDYDTQLFSLSNYYQWIKAPLAVHQGTADQEVPIWWSDELVDTLEENKVDVAYYQYPGADHNLRPNSWSLAVTRSMDFYHKYLK